VTTRLIGFGILTLLLALAALPAGAQVAAKRTLTLAGARTAIAGAVGAARSRQAPGAVIAVVDDGGNLMALERLDGTFAAGATVSIGKARTAALFKRPTSFFEEIIRNGRTPMIALSDFTPLQGGVPIEIDGQIVGAIGVSGAASAQQDEELAIAGAMAVSGAAPAPVSYWQRPEVDAAFAKGSVLLDGRDGRNYMVHASHRDKAGQAEVHNLDTDIIYVLEGTATIVTGGTVVDGKTVEPDEIRGAAIRNGDTRQLSRGDVLVVPNGTPHWFRDVAGPFNYYVVKVR
jgi:glc operon protein GlcG